MKRFLVLALLVSTSVMSAEITVKVNGMVCSLCAQGIEKKFKEVKEVKELKVDLGNKVVYLKTEGDAVVPDSKIKQIITESGYNVASIERK